MSRKFKRKWKRCNWMCAKKDWRDCGKKATHFAPGLGMFYCDDHAPQAQIMRNLVAIVMP